jgi:hypothetical protein
VTKPYRIEREPMPAGSPVQLFRVIVRLPGRNAWGTVQAGLGRADADSLLETLLANEVRRAQERIAYRGGYRR